MPEAAAMNVLVVDDQRSIRELVRQALNGLGIRAIVEAADGRQAFEMLKRRPVHLVISDLNMPTMDGLELLAAVRADRGLKHIGFIMLTSRGEEEMVRKAVALKVNNYLTKPFALGHLRKKIESVFGPLT